MLSCALFKENPLPVSSFITMKYLLCSSPIVRPDTPHTKTSSRSISRTPQKDHAHVHGPCARRTRWTCSDLLGPIVRTPIRGPSTAAAASTPRTTHMCARAHTHTMAPSTIVYSCFVSRMPSRCRSHLWSLTLCARGDLQPVCVRQPVSTSRLIGMLSPAARTSGRIVYALWVHVLPYISLRPPLSTLASYGAPQTQLKPCRRSSLLRG